MATFESKVHALQIEPHPNADRLELAAIGGFRCVVGKGTFVNGDLVSRLRNAEHNSLDTVAAINALLARMKPRNMHRT